MWAYTNETDGEGECEDAAECPRDRGQWQSDRAASFISEQGCQRGGNSGDEAWRVKKIDCGCASYTYKGLGNMLVTSEK
jgi:hypothetical protein